MRTKTKLWVPLFVFFVLSLAVSACAGAASTASCGFLVGTGADGTDTNVHQVIYPGQSVVVGSNERVVYVPCNSRNYIINDGTVINANGDRVGDRFDLIKATTSTGVPIKIAARALWTLNQSDAAMRHFYDVCFKYTCFSTEDIGGGANFSTEGWNGMLAENLGYALNDAAREAAFLVDDTIWQNHNPDQYDLLADEMSNRFAAAMQANLGYPVDLFCGSGNSSWQDPTQPGVGTFTCSNVRIIVDSVDRDELSGSDSTEGAKEINQQRLENAQALYGPNAGDWLALQDTIEKCKSTEGVSCVVSIGPSAPVLVAPDNNSQAPSPTSQP